MRLFGSVKPAQDGTLVILWVLQQTVVKPIFDVLGKIAIHVGNQALQVRLN
jgi:hypothetical protein